MSGKPMKESNSIVELITSTANKLEKNKKLTLRERFCAETYNEYLSNHPNAVSLQTIRDKIYRYEEQCAQHLQNNPHLQREINTGAVFFSADYCKHVLPFYSHLHQKMNSERLPPPPPFKPDIITRIRERFTPGKSR